MITGNVSFPTELIVTPKGRDHVTSLDITNLDIKDTHKVLSLVGSEIFQNQLGSQEPKLGGIPLAKKKVFIVHGRDEAAKYQISRFVEKEFDLEAIILHEQSNQGRTVIENIEYYSNGVVFAIIIMNSDDLGALKQDFDSIGPNSLEPRSRQNVIMELGYFIGKLGRSKVCAILTPGVNQPSDMTGITYLSLSGRGWETDLRKELKAAGLI